MRFSADTLDAVIREAWSHRDLPDGISSVGVVSDRDDLWAIARPDRFEGRYGFAWIEPSHDTMRLVKTTDEAVCQAMACSWFDSSYR